MAITVGAINACRGFSDPARAPKIMEGIRRMDADVVAVPEMFNAAGDVFDPDFVHRLGYHQLHAIQYEDATPHPSVEQHIGLLSRIPVKVSAARLATRNCLYAEIEDPEGGSIFGLAEHSDDRSEDYRVAMVDSFGDQIAHGPLDQVDFDFGDLNSTHGGDMWSRILTSGFVRARARSINNPRVYSLATRLIAMNEGRALESRKRLGFHDADARHRGTKGIFQLDHILVRGGVIATDFKRHKVKGTDHRGITARLQRVS